MKSTVLTAFSVLFAQQERGAGYWVGYILAPVVLVGAILYIISARKKKEK